MIIPGETGLLVPAGDIDALTRAMTDLIDQADLRERLGTAAKERSNLFTASVAVPQFERFYQQIIDRTAGRATTDPSVAQAQVAR